MESNKYSEDVLRISNCLKEVTYAKNVPFSTIRLYFLKYVIDNNIGARTKEDILFDMQVLKMFAKRYTEGGPNALVPVLSRIDDLYGLQGIITNSINEYAKDLFALDDSWARRNVSDTHFKKLMGEVAALDLSGGENESQTFTVGKEIVANLLPVVYDISRSYTRQIGEHTTQDRIAELAGYILNVKDGETFCDFASGIGASTIKIVGTAAARIYNVEINEEIAQVAAMLYIMSGYKNFTIAVDDGLTGRRNECRMDKIFADVPQRFVTGSGLPDSNSLAIERAVDYLNDGGTAVLTVPNANLFRGNPRDIAQRKRLFEGGYVNCVIALPPCRTVTALPVNLIVLSATNNKDVLFIDASSNRYASFFERGRFDCAFTDKGIQTLTDIIKNRAEVAGVSKIVTTLKPDYRLLPASYVEIPKYADDTCTVEEIDAELEELYARFVKLIDDD